MSFLSKTALCFLTFVAVLLLTVFLWHTGEQLYWQNNPEKAFVSITGRPLPHGVKAIAYKSKITDNVLHRSHYWLLTGSSKELYGLVNGTELGRSDEDALYALPDTDQLFNIPKQDLSAGYEEDGQQGRRSWYWIFKDEKSALYEHDRPTR